MVQYKMQQHSLPDTVEITLHMTTNFYKT